MAGMSQYQSVFRVVKNDANNNSRSRSTKQNGLRNGRDNTKSKQDDAHARLQKLEQMVTSMMQTNQDASKLPTPPESNSMRPGLAANERPALNNFSRGFLEKKDTETNYIGGSHWATILENLREVQGVLAHDEEDEEPLTPPAPEGPDIIFDTSGSLTLNDVYDALPPRNIVDKVLFIYFNAKYVELPILHSKKFVREYEAFWADPTQISWLWISLLFSIMHIGLSIGSASGEKIIDYDDAKPAFHILAGRALVTGKYQTAKQYSVEATLLYGITKFIKQEDSNPDAWMIMGIGARLALRMGYHREPRHLPNVTPFEGEMRRRVFHILSTFEILLSLQAGLPPIMHPEDYDTEPPNNIFDEDFDEDCERIPPSRPITDPTPIAYCIYKNSLATSLCRVSTLTQHSKMPPYAETMELDRKLRDMHANIPPHLAMRPIRSSFTDSLNTILKRLNADLVYWQSVCILHRNYLTHDRSNAAFEYSRKRCTDAALHILEQQVELHQVTQPGGQFHNDRWMMSSLTLSAFLVATMIICLELYQCRSSAFSSLEAAQRQTKQFDILGLCLVAWKSRKAHSRDARRVASVIEDMLAKVQRPGNSPVLTPTNSTPGSATQNHGSSIESDRSASTSISNPANAPLTTQSTITAESTTNNNGINVANEQDTSWTFDSPIPWLIERASHAPWNLATLAAQRQSPANTDPLSMVMSEPDDLDWGLVDQYLFGQTDFDPMQSY